jgi:ketosteroid isomerase-like protein
MAASANKQVIEAYFASKGTDYARLLADDVELVEWADGGAPTGIRTHGKAAYVENRGGGEYETRVHRMTEENDVVVVEGTARGPKKDGGFWRVQFVDIFDLANGKIQRLSAFATAVQDSG